MTTAAFLGDSITDGTGAVTKPQFFGAATGARLGWTVFQAGYAGETFLSLAAHVPQMVLSCIASTMRTPDVVVVQAGSNDVGSGATPAAIAANAVSLLTTIRAGLPAATLYVLGIFWHEAPAAAYIAADAAVRAAVTPYARFLGPMADGWIADGNKGIYIWDGIHPTQAGHDYLGTRLASVILYGSTPTFASFATEAGELIAVQP